LNLSTTPATSGLGYGRRIKLRKAWHPPCITGNLERDFKVYDARLRQASRMPDVLFSLARCAHVGKRFRRLSLLFLINQKQEIAKEVQTMRDTETLTYEYEADAKDAYNALDRLIYPEDNIDLERDWNSVTIIATERELKGLKMMLAKLGL